MAMSTADRVFSTPELMEAILLKVTDETGDLHVETLFALQRVSRCFNQFISQPSKCRIIMGLDYCHGKPLPALHRFQNRLLSSIWLKESLNPVLVQMEAIPYPENHTFTLTASREEEKCWSWTSRFHGLESFGRLIAYHNPTGWNDIRHAQLSSSEMETYALFDRPEAS